jgi:glycosyltransferase involved in cell wall biosynthesis
VVLLTIFKPTIFYEIHDFYKTPIQWLNRWCYRSAKGLISTNRLKIPILQKEFGIPEERLFHKPNAVDTSMFRIATTREEARKTLDLPPDLKIILYCGQVILWKGVDGLLEAHAYLRPNEFIYFNVSGDKPTIQEFKEKSWSMNTRNVIVAEGATHKDIPLWLRAADVLVLPNTARDDTSKYDTSPVKLFEYMASGRPIVASDIPSLRNVVDDSTAWFYEPDNPQALADTIHVALDDTDASRKKSEKAQEEAEKYTWDRRFKDIFGFMDTVLSSSQSLGKKYI